MLTAKFTLFTFTLSEALALITTVEFLITTAPLRGLNIITVGGILSRKGVGIEVGAKVGFGATVGPKGFGVTVGPKGRVGVSIAVGVAKIGVGVIMPGGVAGVVGNPSALLKRIC